MPVNSSTLYLTVSIRLSATAEIDTSNLKAEDRRLVAGSILPPTPHAAMSENEHPHAGDEQDAQNDDANSPGHLGPSAA